MVRKVSLTGEYNRPTVVRKSYARGNVDGVACNPIATERSEVDNSNKTSISRVRVRVHPHTPGGVVDPEGERAGLGVRAHTRDEASHSVNSMLELASSMSAKERQELLDQLALQNQLSGRAQSNPDLEMWAESIKTALDEAIGGSGGDSYGVMLLKRLLGSSQCWRPVEHFMVSSKLMELQRNARFSVYLLLARLLVDECRELCHVVGAPLSAKFVANRTGDLGGVFERAFPGYLAAGLAQVVAREMIR